MASYQTDQEGIQYCSWVDTMTDRPILFNGPMVRALLDGRKTQTRRILSSARVFATPERRAFTLRGDALLRALRNADRWRHLEGDGWFWESDAFEWQAPATRTGWMAHLSCYAIGDRLWVRETWRAWSEYDGMPPRAIPAAAAIQYPADNPLSPWDSKARPSIHMPRWANRLTLVVTDVRVQRVQDISEADAIEEGLASLSKDGKLWKHGIPDADGLPGTDDHGWPWTEWQRDPVLAFSRIWDAIHGPGAWDENPWVAAITFETVRANIDEMETPK